MDSAKLIRELRRDGWRLERIKGSHHVFVRPHKPEHVTVPHPNKHLGKGSQLQFANKRACNRRWL